MPDTATPQSATWALRRMLGLSVPCPTCDHHMALKTDEDFRRGFCAFCGMTKFKHITGFRLITGPAEREPYRTEADAYGEEIFDDD